jgi:hypothetical protein
MFHGAAVDCAELRNARAIIPHQLGFETNVKHKAKIVSL